MGSGWLGSASPSCLFRFFLPSRGGLGSGHWVLGTVPLRLRCPGVSPLPPPPPRNRPAGPSSASSSPRTRRPAGKLGEGHRARRKLWDLAGNNSWGRRCGLCAVSLFSGYGSQARAQGEEGERLPGRFLPSPPHSQTQVKSDALGGGVLGAPPRSPFLHSSISFFAPASRVPQPSTGSRLCALTGARVCGVSSTVLTNNSCEKGEGTGADRPTD